MNKTVKYLIRSLKFFVAFSIILILIIVLLAALLPDYSVSAILTPASEGGMFEDGAYPKIFAIYLLFSLIYPALTYVKKEILVDECNFDDYRNTIIEQFEQLGYVFDSENEEVAVFRQRSAFRRFMRLYEDKVSITKGESPFILSGNRKELMRLSGLIRYAIMSNQQPVSKDNPYDFSDSKGKDNE